MRTLANTRTHTDTACADARSCLRPSRCNRRPSLARSRTASQAILLALPSTTLLAQNSAFEALDDSVSQGEQSRLAELGAANTPLRCVALGESRRLSAGDELEAQFFDRRVDLRLETPDTDYLSRLDGGELRAGQGR